MEKKLKVANFIALAVMLVFNFYGAFGLLTGLSVGMVSDKFHTYLTPAGYAFGIWSIIYLWLIVFVFYTGRTLFWKPGNPGTDQGIILKIGWWFVITCAANTLWIIFFVNEMIGASVLMMIVLLFALFKIVIKLDMERNYEHVKNFIFIYWPFSVYSGWVTFALGANIATWISAAGWGAFTVAWSVAVIIILLVVNLFIIFSRYMREFALANIWGLVAVAVANSDGSETVAASAFAAAIILGIVVSLQAYRNRNHLFRID